MTEEEQKQQERFLLLLLALAAVTEDQINAATRPALTTAMRKLRRQIQQMAPDGPFRAYEWKQIAPKTLPVLEQLTQVQLAAMLPQIQTLLPEVQDAANDYVAPDQYQPTPITPATQSELFNVLAIAGAGTLIDLFGNRGNINRYTLQMGNDLDKMVKSMIMRGASTQEISDKVLKVITKNGRPVAKIDTGSFANRMWNRTKNTTSAAVWDAVNKTLGETWKNVPARAWVWNARLDPLTCPVCRPLHNKVVAKPASFVSTQLSNTYPPIHPNCRCVIIPLLLK